MSKTREEKHFTKDIQRKHNAGFGTSLIILYAVTSAIIMRWTICRNNEAEDQTDRRPFYIYLMHLLQSRRSRIQSLLRQQTEKENGENKIE